MRVRIEADSPEELTEKSEQLIGKLAHALHDTNPDLAHRLEKAIIDEKDPLVGERHQAMRDSTSALHQSYVEMLDRMLNEIGEHLDVHVEEQFPMPVHKAQTDDNLVALVKAHGFAAEDLTHESGKFYGMGADEVRSLLVAVSPGK